MSISYIETLSALIIHNISLLDITKHTNKKLDDFIEFEHTMSIFPFDFVCEVIHTKKHLMKNLLNSLIHGIGLGQKYDGYK